LDDKRVTVRDVDSMKQVRVEIAVLFTVLGDIISGKKTFQQ